MATDPIVRLTAGGILLIAFAGALAVVVHGFWLNPEYVMPPIISWMLGSSITGALTLLGVHVGVQGMQVGVSQGATVTKEAIQVNGGLNARVNSH